MKKTIYILLAALPCFAATPLDHQYNNYSKMPVFCEILGVHIDAAQTFETNHSVITQAYRAIALRCHPDKAPGNKDAEALFKTVNGIKEIINSLLNDYKEATLSPKEATLPPKEYVFQDFRTEEQKKMDQDSLKKQEELHLRQVFLSAVDVALLDEYVLPETSKNVKLSDKLPKHTQECFIKMGYRVLEQIQSGTFDSQKDDYFTAIQALGGLAELSSYLYAPNASYVVPSLWLRGFTNIFLPSDPGLVKQQQSYLTAIISVSWALVHMSIEKGEIFERGSFSLIDPDHKIKDFLVGYHRLAEKMGINNFIYDRNPEKGKSSHHKGRSPESQFGIDMRFKPKDGVVNLLPFNHSHILFGKLNIYEQEIPLTFFKLEPVGTGNIACTVAHGFNAVAASVESIPQDARREKDILPQAIDLYKKAIEDIFSPKELNAPDAIRKMYLNIMKIKGQERADGFVTDLKKDLRLDYADLRTGNEVILDLRPVDPLHQRLAIQE